MVSRNINDDIDVYVNGKWFDGSECESILQIIKLFPNANNLEVWVSIGETGLFLSLFKSGENVVVLLGEEESQEGFVSEGNSGREGLEKYILSNGEIYEERLSACISPGLAYQSVDYFMRNGVMDPNVNWKQI